MTLALPSQTRRGTALIVATLVMVALIGLATALTDLTIGTSKEAAYRREVVTVTVTAESCANLALNHLQTDPDLEAELLACKTRSADHTDNDLTDEVASDAIADPATGRSTLNGLSHRATYKYIGTITVPLYGVSESQAVYQLTTTVATGGPARLFESTGARNPIASPEHYRRRRVEALFTPVPSAIFRQAMFARRGYQYMGSAKTDSWNSTDGATSYAAATQGNQGDLASEGTIVVQKPGNVLGDVNCNVRLPIPTLTYNPAGADDLRTVLASGKLASGTLPRGFVAPAVPDPTVEYKYRVSSLEPSANNSITILPNSKVTIYVDGTVSLKKDWVVPKTSTLRIVQDNCDAGTGGPPTINGNITVGCIDRPASFQFITLYDGTVGTSAGAAFDFQMNGSAKFGGVLFAPNSSFKLNGTFDFFGALIANSMRETDNAADLGKVNGSFYFHYDESLGNLTLPFPPTLVVVGWRAYDLSMAEYRDDQPTVRWDAP